MPEARGGVLLVTRNFPPLRGGMERLNQRMVAGLAESGPVSLVGPAGCARFAPSAMPVVEVPASSPIRFLPHALAATLRIAMQRRSNQQCGNTDRDCRHDARLSASHM